jgi:selenocysteine lyase/cysteine desulfurase
MSTKPNQYDDAEVLRSFVESVGEGDFLEALRHGLIGEGVNIDGPVGVKPLVYADYVASGRAVAQIERFILEEVLPFYSNSHSEASYCGAFMNRLRAEARREIARIFNASDEYAVIFAGAGATAGINRLASLFLDGLRDGVARPVVLLGPYEHHSNILPWRESGVEVVELPEGASGGVDLAALEHALSKYAREGRFVLCALSAASNVTGIITDVEATTALINRFGALSIWDYAGGGPYLPIDMRAGGGIDAIVLSPHKFVGGPGASGLLVVRKAAVRRRTPSLPGGGTVSFVSPWSHTYVDSLSAREEAGTPNVIGDIRAALVVMIKEKLGQDFIQGRCSELRDRAVAAWRREERLELIGPLDIPRLPIFSFRVRDGSGGYVHHQLVTRILSDYYGVQARGGCACAGPYAHRLLNLTRERSDALFAAIKAGAELDKPGWVRLNLSYLLENSKADYIIESVAEVARRAAGLSSQYECDASTARFQRKR